MRKKFEAEVVENARPAAEYAFALEVEKPRPKLLHAFAEEVLKARPREE